MVVLAGDTECEGDEGDLEGKPENGEKTGRHRPSAYDTEGAHVGGEDRHKEDRRQQASDASGARGRDEAGEDHLGGTRGIGPPPARPGKAHGDDRVEDGWAQEMDGTGDREHSGDECRSNGST